MKIKNILTIFIIGFIASGNLQILLSNSTKPFYLRDLKNNRSFKKTLKDEDHDGSLILKDRIKPIIQINTDEIGASDTSTKMPFISNSNCNILLMGSSVIAASALPKSYRLESILRERSNCNVVNIASDGESLQGSLLKYQLIDELKIFNIVFLMSGKIDSNLAVNPSLKEEYEPILNTSFMATLKRKIITNKSIADLIMFSKNIKNIFLANKPHESKNNNINVELDIKDEIEIFKNNLKAFNYLVSANSSRLVLITTPYEPKYWKSFKDGSKLRDSKVLNLFNSAIREVSTLENIELIDSDTIFTSSNKNLLYDTSHLNIEGANLLAFEILKKLQ